METYFEWKFMIEMIGLGIFVLIVIFAIGVHAFIAVNDWFEDRKRKKRKGAGK